DRVGLGIIEARPAGAALELGLGDEQLLAATGAIKRAGAFFVIERAATRALGAVLAHDVILLGGENSAPFRFGMADRILLGFRVGAHDDMPYSIWMLINLIDVWQCAIPLPPDPIASRSPRSLPSSASCLSARSCRRRSIRFIAKLLDFPESHCRLSTRPMFSAIAPLCCSSAAWPTRSDGGQRACRLLGSVSSAPLSLRRRKVPHGCSWPPALAVFRPALPPAPPPPGSPNFMQGATRAAPPASHQPPIFLVAPPGPS